MIDLIGLFVVIGFFGGLGALLVFHLIIEIKQNNPFNRKDEDDDDKR